MTTNQISERTATLMSSFSRRVLNENNYVKYINIHNQRVRITRGGMLGTAPAALCVIRTSYKYTRVQQ